MRVQEDYRAVQGSLCRAEVIIFKSDGGKMRLLHVSVAQSRWLRYTNSCSDKVVTLIICGLQLLGHLHVGLNNTSTGLRLTAWPTAGIILTTTQEQEEETVRTPELFKSYGAPCGWKVTLHMVFTNYLLKTENCQRWDQSLKCFLADHIQLLTPPPNDPASSPVVVSVTECPDRDGEGLPHGVQVVLDHLGLVADSEPGDTWETSSWFMWRDVNVASRRNLLAHVRRNKQKALSKLRSKQSNK